MIIQDMQAMAETGLLNLAKTERTFLLLNPGSSIAQPITVAGYNATQGSTIFADGGTLYARSLVDSHSISQQSTVGRIGAF